MKLPPAFIADRSNEDQCIHGYDFNLKWMPLDPGTPGGTASSPNAESVSLFSAIEEQLGLKLTSTKGPGQVLVIDHVERPSEN